MITNAYKSVNSIIRPERMYKSVENFPKTIISCYSGTLTQLLAEETEAEPICVIEAGGRDTVVYAASYNGKRIGFYHGMPGGSASAMLLEPVIDSGAEDILFLGTCGTLIPDILPGTIFVPTCAYRDEGTSYHYVPASDFLEIWTADELSKRLANMKVKHEKASIWTTDAIYRVTSERAEEMKKCGCVCLDMESASVISVGIYKNVNVYELLYVTDCFYNNEWNPGIVSPEPKDVRRRIIQTALKVVTCR